MTNTVTLLEIVPIPLEAVRVYVVFDEGLTTLEPWFETDPIPLSIETLVALITLQLKVVDWPTQIEAGTAERAASRG